MVIALEMFEKPKLNDPVLIEGLPGIGFIANIATLHLIHEFRAKKLAEIHSSAFQDLGVTTETGEIRSPLNELYYYKNPASKGRDIIIWYGNTQALTTFGQYELCDRILEITRELGCRFLITLGGYRQEETRDPPQLFCAATDSETMNSVVNLGVKVMVGEIFGIAGLLVGLGKIRGFKGFSLLVETLGAFPDVKGTRYAFLTLNKYLNLNVDLSRLENAGDETKRILESFGVLRPGMEEKRKEEHRFRWSV